MDCHKKTKILYWGIFLDSRKRDDEISPPITKKLDFIGFFRHFLVAKSIVMFYNKLYKHDEVNHGNSNTNR